MDRLPTPSESAAAEAKAAAAWELLQSGFEVCVVDDSRTGEIVLLHKHSKTLMMSDLLYKSSASIVGPGGTTNHYSQPEWFAEVGRFQWKNPVLPFKNPDLLSGILISC